MKDLENVSYKDSTLCTPDSWVTDMARFNQTHTHTRTHAQTHTHTLPLRNFFMAAECHHGATPALAAPQLCSRVFWPAAQISPLLNYEWTSWLRWVPSFPLIPPSPFFNSSKRTGATVPAVREQLNACWKGLENYGMRKGISCDGWW